MLTFQEAVNEARKNKQIEDQLILLLGNGFSQACGEVNSGIDNLFSYGSLLDVKAEALPNRKTLAELFNTVGTTNFEGVLSTLNACKRIYQFIRNQNSESLLNEIDVYSDAVKKHLIRAVISVNPEQQHQISDESHLACGLFLKEFNLIFTLSYDLLLYWAIRNCSHKIQELRKFTDGFSLKIAEEEICYWSDYYSTRFFYLHGALHLFNDDEDCTYKLINPEIKTGSNLKEKIMNNINNNRFPLIVTEGDSNKKLRQIRENPYLNMAINKLKKRQGVLFIYGVSFEYDDHILETIKKNPNIKTVYVGVYKGNDAPLTKFKEKVSSKNISAFDASSVNPWKPCEEKTSN